MTANPVSNLSPSKWIHGKKQQKLDREQHSWECVKISFPPPLRSHIDVHLTEHVQFLPKPLRIPEQPTEHAPWGLYYPLLPSSHSWPCSSWASQSTAGNGPAHHLPWDMLSGSHHHTVSVRKATVGKLLCCRAQNESPQPCLLISYT